MIKHQHIKGQINITSAQTMKTQNHLHNSNHQEKKEEVESSFFLLFPFLKYLTLGLLFTSRAQKCGKHIDKKSTLAISKPTKTAILTLINCATSGGN